MEEIKTVNAEIKNKEDDMGLTTQNQDEIEQSQVPKDAALWKRAKKIVAKEGNEDDASRIMFVYNSLLAEKKEDEGKEPKPTVDEQINAVGADVPTVKRPKAGSKSKAKIEDVQGLVYRECIDRAAILFLARTLLTPTDLEDFKTLYPSLF